MPTYADPQDGIMIAPAALHAWTAGVLMRCGTPQDIAADVAENLVAADRRGIASHGTARLGIYVSLVEAGVLDPAGRPVLARSRPSIGLFDARNGWGQHACRIAMDWAIERAHSQGTATAIVGHSNHYGIAGWYSLRAAAAGLIGMSFTNASPLVAPTRSRVPMLGTNPISIAAPAGRWGAFCLDMATSTVPLGRIEVAARRGEALLAGWAIDEAGRPALTPEAARRGALQPLGGEEATAGYKGYGLGLAVDLLTGVLSGSSFGPNILGAFSLAGPSDLGQAFIVLDPAAIDEAGTFSGRLEAYLDRLTEAPVIDGAPGRVLIPGEPEVREEERTAEHGIVMDRAHAVGLHELGVRLGTPFPVVVPGVA